MELKIKDYKNILEYYNKPIPKKRNDIKVNAETIINNKLCRCIKKIDPVYEAKSIGICTKTIINNKGYIRGQFSCGKDAHITINKKTKKTNKKKTNKKQRRKTYKKRNK